MRACRYLELWERCAGMWYKHGAAFSCEGVHETDEVPLVSSFFSPGEIPSLLENAEGYN